MDDRDEELADAIRDLSRTIDELREEFEPRRHRRFRPPTPTDLLRVTDEVAIPAALAMLQANVRALEAFQRGVKLLRTEQAARDRTAATAAETSRRADRLRRTTVSQLDAALSELQRAVSTGSLPVDDRARSLLEETRTLRDEVDRRLAEAADGGNAIDGRDGASTTGYTIEIEDGDDGSNRADGDDTARRLDAPAESDRANVDVDAELETLKDRYGPNHEEAKEGGESADNDETTGNDESADKHGDENGDSVNDGSGENSDGRNDDGSQNGNGESSGDAPVDEDG